MSSFIARTPKETLIYTGPPTVSLQSSIFEDEVWAIEISNDGRTVCGIGKEGIPVYDIPSASKISEIPVGGALRVMLSNTGKYLVTLKRPDKALKGTDHNLQVWEVESGKCIWSLHRSDIKDEGWPIVHWLHDDSSLFVPVTNTIHLYTAEDGFSRTLSSYNHLKAQGTTLGVSKKLPIKGIFSFSVSPGSEAKVGAYVPEAKNVPASVLLYPVSRFREDNEDLPLASNRKSFYRVSSVRFLWNSLGSAMLCWSYSDVDVTNQSYYGEQQLHFFEGDSDVSCKVPNIPNGPIHDVQWAPSGDYFAVVAGFMPSKTLLFDSKCKPVFDLGSGAHNFVRFNPFGRFLCVAGFGNLPGDIVFYEKKMNGNCKRMSSIRCPSVSLDWSPCGRYVLSSITAPRLRVDNGFKIFTYLGEEIQREDFGVLFEARWVPVPDGTFVDRPISPDKKSKILEKSKQEETSTAYVPPHLRGSSRTPVQTSLNLGQSDDKGGRIGTLGREKGGIPGSSSVSKAALKNAKRRAKKRAEGQKVPAANLPSEPSLDSTAKSPEQSEEEPSTGMTPEEKQKRIRALKKKLMQITRLKERKDQPGVTLEKEQLEKIETEDAVLAELSELES